MGAGREIPPSIPPPGAVEMRQGPGGGIAGTGMEARMFAPTAQINGNGQPLALTPAQLQAWVNGK
jgi:hypothetical protein